MDTLYSNHQVQPLLKAYGTMVRDRLEHGWHGYFLSFMFSHIPGSDASRLLEMKKHLVGSTVGWQKPPCRKPAAQNGPNFFQRSF